MAGGDDAQNQIEYAQHRHDADADEGRQLPGGFLAGDFGDASISSGTGSASMFAAAGVLSGCGMVAVGTSCGVVSGVSCSKGFC